jgi:hypothetical protein
MTQSGLVRTENLPAANPNLRHTIGTRHYPLPVKSLQIMRSGPPCATKPTFDNEIVLRADSGKPKTLPLDRTIGIVAV